MKQSFFRPLLIGHAHRDSAKKLHKKRGPCILLQSGVISRKKQKLQADCGPTADQEMGCHSKLG
jgi:hypothetical protein